MAARYGVRVWLALVTVYIVWGSTFIALAIVIRDLPPFLAMSVRHLVAGGVLLAVSRAIGETMIVVMAAGLAANLSANPFASVTTVTTQIVQLLTGDQEFDSAKTLAAFALGLVLFVVTLLLNILLISTVALISRIEPRILGALVLVIGGALWVFAVFTAARQGRTPSVARQAVNTLAEMRTLAQIWGELNMIIERMVAEGRTLEQITAANPTQPFDARIGPNAAAGAANFIRQAHGGILAARRA